MYENPETRIGDRNRYRQVRTDRMAIEFLRIFAPLVVDGSVQLTEGRSLQQFCADNARELIAELDKQA